MITVIIGPTASGKSALAVGRARESGAARIINADAMQCYDALPILTAQPSVEEQENIPHTLYSVLGSNARMSAADWVSMASAEIKAAYTAGETPMLVGGTGLYIKALMEGLSPIPDIPDDIRAHVRAREKQNGLAPLYAQLCTQDPVMAARLKPGDTQRILRALEVLEGTGKSLSHWQNIPPVIANPEWHYHVVQINPSKEVLEQKIRTRLSIMIKNGAMDEVEKLSTKIDRGTVPDDAPITVAHGFKILRQVIKGQKKLEDALEDIAIETRQYTKRQRTWLRHQIKADETF